VALATALTLVCCGRADSSSGGSDSALRSAAAPPSGSVAAAPQPDTTGDGIIRTVGPTTHQPSDDGGMPATLSEVRTALRGDSSVRVVFQFAESRLPGYTIAYANQPPTSCGSGKGVDVTGKAYLAVRLSPAQAHAARGPDQVATAEPRDRRPALGPLHQLTQTCDFEGVVQWVLGLREQLPYRAFELAGPTRLVIDVFTDGRARRAGSTPEPNDESDYQAAP
jgi:hypothetical protein